MAEIDEATWVMLYHNGEQQIFAKESKSGADDKFTVVIWLGGEDPECINDILGDSIEMMKFRY